MNLTFTEYRSQVLRTMRTKFDVDYIVHNSAFSTWRFDNICANHWKLNVEVFDCILAAEKYFVEDLMVYPIKCDKCDGDMADENYIASTCSTCKEKARK